MNQQEKNKQVLMHLLLISGAGPAVIIKLITHFFVQAYPHRAHEQVLEVLPMADALSLQEIYDYEVSDFIHKVGLSLKTAEFLHSGLRDKTLFDQEQTLLDKHTIHLVTLADSEYPTLLRHIHLPPIALYVQGTLAPEAKRIALVGARKADKYAEKVIEHLVPSLVDRQWQIVSGGAMGADTMAHKATLAADGITLAVLGSGLLHKYPEYIKKLFDQISATGALISSFPLKSSPEPAHFPARNRIISGLSSGTVVVQAAKRSGALITADYAMEQGRTVFAVPGSVFHELSAGCHALIGQGAKMVREVNDIFEEFGEAENMVEEKAPVARQQSLLQTHDQPHVAQKISDPFLIHFDVACTLDELSTKTKLSLEELQDKLFMLQLEGKVKQTFSGLWERI